MGTTNAEYEPLTDAEWAARIERVMSGKASRAKYIPPDERPAPYRFNLEDYLLWWAKDNYPRAYAGFFARPGDREWESKALAAIVVRRAAGDSGWLVRLAAGRFGPQLAALGRYITTAGGYPLPGTFRTFADWVKAVREAP